VCYYVKFGRSASKGCGHKQKETPKLSSIGVPSTCVGAVYDPLELCPFLTCYPAEFGRSRSDGTRVIKEIRLNNLTPRIPPFNVMKCHRSRYGYIRHLRLHILTFHGDHEPISYTVSEINGDFGQKSQFSPPPRIPRVPLATGQYWTTSRNYGATRQRRKSDDIFSGFDTIRACDGRTDGLTDRHRPTASTALTPSVAWYNDVLQFKGGHGNGGILVQEIILVLGQTDRRKERRITISIA